MKPGAARGGRPPPARARRSRGGQRQRLIDACISALHLYGPSRTTVEKVVAIAKMSPGIVRFYFDSKAAMLVASLQYLAAEFEERLLKPVAALASTPVAALDLLVDLYLDPEIASPRKVSVWYAFWGEASSRQEYYDICGQKDESFAALVRRLIAGLTAETGQAHLDPDAVALGLIGALEILWQDFAFKTEREIDRPLARKRCMAYLRSLFPGRFPQTSGPPDGVVRDVRQPALTYDDAGIHALERVHLFRPAWTLVGHESELPEAGRYLAEDLGVERTVIVRDLAGAVHALRNSCPAAPHAVVVGGRGVLAGRIACRWHALEFDLAGHAPPGASWPDLATLGLSAVGGWLFVGPVDGAPPKPRNWPEVRGLLRQAPIEIAVEADWKVLVEQWLEAVPHDAALETDPTGGSIDWWFDTDGGSGWSARRYAALAGNAPALRWQRRFLAPHQLVEVRPDGVSVLQAVPVAAGRCVLRRRDYSPPAPWAGARGAAFLAGRLAGLTRRGRIEAAESTQKGMIKFAYRSTVADSGSPATAWFRAWLAAHLPASAAGPTPSGPTIIS